MKTNLSTGIRSLRNLPATIVAAALLAGSFTTASRGAAFDSPSGLTWDFVISGPRNGVAYITFTGTTGGTLSGREILVPRKKSVPNPTDERGGNDQRNPDGSSSSTNQVDQVFGPADITGSWSFDTSGKVVGFFAESTNSPVGFRASVTQGSKMTMLASIPAGKSTYTGRPAVLLVGNYAGAWNGFKSQNNQTLVEIFNMTLTGATGPNEFAASGTQAGYSYSGIAIISVQKKIAFGLDVSDGHMRTTFGSFNLKSAKATTKGWDQLEGPPGAKATFKVEQQPVVP
jgi:hypothetical protein